MKLDDMVTSDYLKQADVTPPIRVTIKSEEEKNMAKDGQPAQIKCVLGFEETDKKLVCNITNFKLIRRNTGKNDSKDWIGEQIDLWFNPDIEYGGDIVGGIRVLTPQPQVQPVVPTRAQPVAEDDDLPF